MNTHLERHFVWVGAWNTGTLDDYMVDAVRETEHVAQVSRRMYALLPDRHDDGQIAEDIAGVAGMTDSRWTAYGASLTTTR
jgi:hypothetical protein